MEAQRRGDLLGPSSEPGEAPGELKRSSSGVKKHHHKHNLKHRYELLETLGRGTYGKVKKAIERQSGREHLQACTLSSECIGGQCAISVGRLLKKV
ncbi:hypothetical protein DNTS_034178 [Danionella cerebrum]|uniref:Protein kinase domain-containing protein n=1 Tax=Danionella cerebrum TaxID=2873325 RepID=A0A553Q8P3_9TELE|nr:hypothetical protein DNTS_034178 [Danionella translucida]